MVLCGPESQLGRTEIVHTKKELAFFSQTGSAPAGLEYDTGIDGPEVRWHRQAADEHNQAEESA